MTLQLTLFFLLIFVNIGQLLATFGFGGGGGCSCAQTPICPPEPVCAPQTPVIIGPAPVLAPAPIPVQVPVQVAPPPPPVQVVQVPTTVGGCYSGYSGGYSGYSGCGPGVGGGCFGGGGAFDYYPSYPCSSCKRARRREFIKRKLARNRLRLKRSTMPLMKVNSDGHFEGNSGNTEKKRRKQDSKCNSEKLRRIMKKAVGMKTSTLKRNIQMLVERKLGSQYNVLCGKGEFSYTTTTDEFCQAQVMNRTCYVFRRNSSPMEDEEVEDYDEPNGN